MKPSEERDWRANRDSPIIEPITVVIPCRAAAAGSPELASDSHAVDLRKRAPTEADARCLLD